MYKKANEQIIVIRSKRQTNTLYKRQTNTCVNTADVLCNSEITTYVHRLRAKL